MRRTARVGLIATLVLAGCIPPASNVPPSPQAEAAAEPEPVLPPAAPETAGPATAAAPLHPANWADQPQTAGDWRWRSTGAESIAEFADPAGAMLARLVCTADKQMLLTVSNSYPQASGLKVRTETQDRQLETTARADWLESRLSARDTLLDAIAFSRGRFALEVQGGLALYLPSYPELTRVIEDCREGAET
ncbi:MAG: hypothetical protein N2Z59_00955 [Alteraurantiacibacter sp.]|nr:hypothetical protein [Alteraurantiacibacter sp.]